MTDTLRHRGPDDGGTFVDDARRVGLGNRRLAIVDLSSTAISPWRRPTGATSCSYNGEIYNFAALRSELEAGRATLPGRVGHRGTGKAMAQHWGLMEALQRCNGMFALALWDRQAPTLSLARDRFGEKPLYYGWAKGTLPLRLRAQSAAGASRL